MMRCCFSGQQCQQEEQHAVHTKQQAGADSPPPSFRIGTQIALFVRNHGSLSSSSSSSNSSSGDGSDEPLTRVVVGSSNSSPTRVILPCEDSSRSSAPCADVAVSQLSDQQLTTCKDPHTLPPVSNRITILQPSDKRQSSRQLRDALCKADPASLHTSSLEASSQHAQLLQYVVQHGRGIMSLSTFQPGLHHFVMPGIGYIAYGMMTNGPDFLHILTPVALADPVCDPTNYETIAAAFLSCFPKAMFMQVSAPFALVLRSCGLLVNSIGGETRLDLASYSMSGHTKRGLRSAIASAAKQGVRVEEVMHSSTTAVSSSSGTGLAPPGAAADWSGVAAEMREVDAAWVAHKGQHAARIWFMNRLPVFAPEFGVRKFTARDSGGRLLAFVFFDAAYEDGAVVGWYANVTRMRPDAHPGVLNLIMSQVIDTLRAESQLAPPAKQTSMRRSQRKKLEAADAAPAGSADVAPAAPDSAAKPGASSDRNSGGGVRFVSLGLSPLHQMDDGTFRHSSSLSVRRLLELSWRRGAGFYPFASLASAKAKYGGGLHSGRHADPAVTYHQAYLAHSHHSTAAVALFDLGKLLGFWNQPADAAASYVRFKAAAAAAKVRQLLRAKKRQPGGPPQHKEEGQP